MMAACKLCAELIDGERAGPRAIAALRPAATAALLGQEPEGAEFTRLQIAINEHLMKRHAETVQQCFATIAAFQLWLVSYFCQPCAPAADGESSAFETARTQVRDTLRALFDAPEPFEVKQQTPAGSGGVILS